MRLIDAESYIKYCDDRWIPLNVDAVLAQQTVDAVPVIRCNECKHYEMAHNEANGWCEKNELPFVPWDFCSLGERKEE